MDRSPELEQFARDWATKLERVHPRIERCDVVIERPHQHQHRGQRVRVRVTVAIPGPDVIVSRDHGLDGAHEDAYVAVRDAFRAARSQLEARAQRKRTQDVKVRDEPEHGRVTYLDVEREWGHIEANSRQIYFHRNSVIGDDPLEIGDEVRFREKNGDKGPQASTVHRVGEQGRHELSRH